MWDEYLAEPDDVSLGICCSGGGIRSASFALGALQALRDEGALFEADHIASASGGGYIAIAHSVLVSETLKRAAADDAASGEEGEPTPIDWPGLEHELFARQAPWSGGSPEDQHFRFNLKYLASGAGGWIWLGLNLLYGMVRHLLPFLATFYLTGFVLGRAFYPWLGCTLRAEGQLHCPARSTVLVTYGDLIPLLLLVAGLLVVAGLLLGIRNYGQTHSFKDDTMATLQYLPISTVVLAIVVFIVLIGIPAALLWLQHAEIARHVDVWTKGFTLVGVAGLISAVSSFVVKHASKKWFRIATSILIALSAPILILVPIIGFTYWNAQWGPLDHDYLLRWFLLAASVGTLLLFAIVLNEVTSVPHLFYRERLASTFIGYRKRSVSATAGPMLSYKQPPWVDRLRFSEMVQATTPHARIPNLIVCAAVNLSGDLPAGRLGASFTFECSRVGGPATGYVETSWMEQKDAGIAMTMPGLMAVSGAAVSPSMGKGTFTALRFVMAMFDLRLGVWLPNPHKEASRLSPRQIREGVAFVHDPATVVARPLRPGALYVFREAFGLNSLRRKFVYVTDGGHWENLGLVELLRRGCTRIVCIDCAGGDTENSATLAEAMALAQADLGVRIHIDLSDVKMVDGLSPKGYALGRMEFPNGKEGVLMYVPAVIPKRAPHDVIAYGKHDKKFPNNPTSDQFFKEQTEEAYRALGRHNMDSLIHQQTLSPEIPPSPLDMPPSPALEGTGVDDS